MGLMRTMVGRQCRIIENNIGVLKVSEKVGHWGLSPRIIDGKGNRARDYLLLEPARLSDNGLAIKADQVGRMDRNSMSEIS